MRQELKHRLLAWKNDVHPGETKKVFISDNPFTVGEDIVRLEKSLSDTRSTDINVVIVSNKFITSDHLSDDLSHLNNVISSLEKEFNERLRRFSQLN